MHLACFQARQSCVLAYTWSQWSCLINKWVLLNIHNEVPALPNPEQTLYLAFFLIWGLGLPTKSVQAQLWNSWSFSADAAQHCCFYLDTRPCPRTRKPADVPLGGRRVQPTSTRRFKYLMTGVLVLQVLTNQLTILPKPRVRMLLQESLWTPHVLLSKRF